MRHWVSRQFPVFAARPGACEGQHGPGVWRVPACRVQKSLRHRNFAIALWIWTSGHAGRGLDCADDAGAGQDGAAAGVGDERIRGEAANHAFGRSARGVARNPTRQAHVAGTAMAGKATAQETRRPRRFAARAAFGANFNGLEDLKAPGMGVLGRTLMLSNAQRGAGARMRMARGSTSISTGAGPRISPSP